MDTNTISTGDELKKLKRKQAIDNYIKKFVSQINATISGLAFGGGRIRCGFALEMFLGGIHCDSITEPHRAMESVGVNQQELFNISARVRAELTNRLHGFLVESKEVVTDRLNTADPSKMQSEVHFTISR